MVLKVFLKKKNEDVFLIFFTWDLLFDDSNLYAFDLLKDGKFD